MSEINKLQMFIHVNFYWWHSYHVRIDIEMFAAYKKCVHLQKMNVFQVISLFLKFKW